ncbi:MAG: ribonuclease HII [Firmicutes bacterium]|jgi:ribonuclease HII|nr:ribonuclease HII [Bacillota bacterium]
MSIYPPKKEIDFSSWTTTAIKEYLNAGEGLSSQEVAALSKDGRVGVRKLILSFLKRQDKEKHLRERLNKMASKQEELHKKGYIYVAGVDEAGRGPLAGPVVAAAVILDTPRDYCWRDINDSKKLSPKKREQLYRIIVGRAKALAVGTVDVAMIDRLNIHRASLEAMRRAVQQLCPQPQFVLCDGFLLPDLEHPQEAVRGGDSSCLSIAAASIVAKVTRDRLMRAYEHDYPGYGFAQNKGYPTAEHKKALQVLGLSPIHRRSFRCL